MVAKLTMATRVVIRVRGEHAQGLRSLCLRGLCLVSGILPTAAVTSFEVTVITAGSVERVFSNCPCLESAGFQFSLVLEMRLRATEDGLFSILLCSTSRGADLEIGRYAAGWAVFAGRFEEVFEVFLSWASLRLSITNSPPTRGDDEPEPAPSSSAADPNDRVRI